MNTSPINTDMRAGSSAALMEDVPGGFHTEEHFERLLYLERKRCERSGRPLLLLLIDLGRISDEEREKAAWITACSLGTTTREIDLRGWYHKDRTIGVIFTECNVFDKQEIMRKIGQGLERGLGPLLGPLVSLELHVCATDGQVCASVTKPDPALYPDVERKYDRWFSPFLVKRAIDIAGSLAGFLLFSPFFLVIPILIRLTSPGPVLFRQARVGLYGKQFQFYKFRTMYVNNDERVHKEYVRKLIAGKAAEAEESGSMENIGNGVSGVQKPLVYKIKNDQRITPVGRILRKTSLDELPQFINVLLGDMSLVGPRPPIPYEVESYDVWHRCRIVEVKPGITGLWQVMGRSSTTFDEMVRLDIRYSREWSLWLDLKILVMTPWAVIKGKGAY